VKVPGWGSWSFDPILVIVLIAAAAIYVRMYRRAGERVGHSVGAGHWVAYGAGLLALAVALLSPLDAIGDTWLLSAHMMQHVLLSDIAPALLVLGLRAPILPLGLSRRALRGVAPGGEGTTNRALALLTSPYVAVPLWAAATWIWAVPSVFDYAAGHVVIHALEHATLFYTGLALWWLIVDPLPSARRRPNGQRLALLGFTRLASACVCVPLTWLSHVEYPRYVAAPRSFGLSALADQHLAGAAMCFVEILVFAIAFVVVFVDVLSRSEGQMTVIEAAGQPREQH
jgi:cytochrome c oxidase assembly factor CtaG